MFTTKNGKTTVTVSTNELKKAGACIPGISDFKNFFFSNQEMKDLKPKKISCDWTKEIQTFILASNLHTSNIGWAKRNKIIPSFNIFALDDQTIDWKDLQEDTIKYINNCTFNHCDLAKMIGMVDVSNSKFYKSVIQQTNYRSMTFDHNSINDSTISQCMFYYVTFSNNDFKDSYISGNLFVNCNFIGTKITKSTFKDCTFVNCTFTDVKFDDVKFYSGSSSGLDFNNCQYTKIFNKNWAGSKASKKNFPFKATKVKSF